MLPAYMQDLKANTSCSSDDLLAVGRTGRQTTMTYHEHQEVEAIETVFVPRKTRESVYEMNVLQSYGY